MGSDPHHSLPIPPDDDLGYYELRLSCLYQNLNNVSKMGICFCRVQGNYFVLRLSLDVATRSFCPLRVGSPAVRPPPGFPSPSHSSLLCRLRVRPPSGA